MRNGRGSESERCKQAKDEVVEEEEEIGVSFTEVNSMRKFTSIQSKTLVFL